MISITRAEQIVWLKAVKEGFLVLDVAGNNLELLSCIKDCILFPEYGWEYAADHAINLCSHVALVSREQVWDTITDTLLGKGDDYAGENRFSAFVFAAKFAKVPKPETVIRAQIGIKIHRLENLLKQEHGAKFESVADNAYDLLGYILLLGMMQAK